VCREAVAARNDERPARDIADGPLRVDVTRFGADTVNRRDADLCRSERTQRKGPCDAATAGARLPPCHPQGMWFLVGMDVNLEGDPLLAGLYGPFDAPEAARAYQPRVEENGTLLVLTEATDPSRYPWAQPGETRDVSP